MTVAAKRCLQCDARVAPDTAGFSLTACSILCYRRMANTWAVALLAKIANLPTPSRAREMARVGLKKENIR